MTGLDRHMSIMAGKTSFPSRAGIRGVDCHSICGFLLLGWSGHFYCCHFFPTTGEFMVSGARTAWCTSCVVCIPAHPHLYKYT